VNRRKILCLLLTACTALVLTAGPARGASMEELKERFKSRYQAILAAKNEGVVGETMEGFLDLVKPNDAAAPAKQLIADENGDRRELYRLIAEKEKTTPETVAHNNAIRNYKNAASGHYLRDADGKWKQKA
jgi:uncharacterized protein YdbL (DUF1318 family)